MMKMCERRCKRRRDELGGFLDCASGSRPDRQTGSIRCTAARKTAEATWVRDCVCRGTTAEGKHLAFDVSWNLEAAAGLAGGGAGRTDEDANLRTELRGSVHRSPSHPHPLRSGRVVAGSKGRR